MLPNDKLIVKSNHCDKKFLMQKIFSPLNVTE